MIRLAAIDLKGGEVVQLVGGDPDQVRVRLGDPAAVARQWECAGFEALHVIDLDAALACGSNLEVVAEILAAATVPVQVGGGVRDLHAAERLLGLGAARVIVGTRAVEDEGWRAEALAAFPQRLVIAADALDQRVVTRGWTRVSSHRVVDFVAQRESEPWAAVLVTDVSREGRMSGVDRALFADVVGRSAHEVQAAGGIRDAADLAALEDAGVAGVVLGMALYTGALKTPETIARPSPLAHPSPIAPRTR